VATIWQGVPGANTDDLSPTRAAVCDQDQLEPILRSEAERLGTQVRFNTELISFDQDEQGVHGRIRDRASGDEDIVTANYLIAADGTNGATRDALGIERHGPGVLQHWMNVIFETNLSPTLEGRPLRAIFLTDINGTFVPRAGGRWLMAVQYVPERGERPEDFTDDRCCDLIRRGAGRSDVSVKIVDARPWDAAALVAERFVEGRVFIMGDAAHLMPPTGGFGGNTGIQDAHNLAWKLDAVLRGQAGPRLLESYDEERRPVAERTLAQALARLQAWFKDPSKRLPPAEPIVDDDAVTFGYTYPAGAFLDEGGTPSGQAFENPRAPSARPGSRAPHVLVQHQGKLTSTIDLFSGHWAIVVGTHGAEWLDGADRVDGASAFAPRKYQAGLNLDDVDGRLAQRYGIGDEGAVLIRPDGIIAWRARTQYGDPRRILSDAFEYLSCRHVLTPR
jgi:putative polyketide hydroxylase